jgi:molybdenum-dependent DNA-binding transcriptional regulator ModE
MDENHHCRIVMSKSPDFEGLAMFAKVTEERSFAAAARAMGVSVATVSRAVTRLEDRLGGRLFDGTSRRLALTDYGHRLAERASKIYSEAEDFARETSSKPRGLVKLTAPLSFGARWVAPILPAFFRQYPDVAIESPLKSGKTNRTKATRAKQTEPNPFTPRPRCAGTGAFPLSPRPNEPERGVVTLIWLFVRTNPRPAPNHCVETNPRRCKLLVE